LELGGVGALKQQAFFSGLDWGKLELKEIQPPEDFSVDHDEDLRHFHDEFVNMTIPRSVREMSKLDFLPKHCESDNFRGFSFIGESFPLPERTASEQEHYWNNEEDDGQSLSECASSVFDDDLGDFSAPEPVPEKKKRPPRKKKNKQQLVPPLETTNENETNENAATDTKEGSDGKHDAEEKAEKDKKNLQSSDGEPDVVPNKQTANPFAGKESLNPNAKSWSLNPTKPAPQASVMKPTTAPQPTQVLPKPVATPSYTPKPGTWASLAVGKAKPINIRAAAQSTLAKPISSSAPINNRPTKATMVSPQTPSKSLARAIPLSPDWRTHAVSGRRQVQSPKSTTKQNLIPPPPISQPVQHSWPSLGDFPPPPGAKPKEEKKSMGAWGR